MISATETKEMMTKKLYKEINATIERCVDRGYCSFEVVRGYWIKGVWDKVLNNYRDGGWIIEEIPGFAKFRLVEKE